MSTAAAPTTKPNVPSATDLPGRRVGLWLTSEDEVIAELARLRRGHRRLGGWTLAQACWHVGELIEKFLRPGTPGATPTPEQAAVQARFFSKAREPRGFDGVDAPAAFQPAAACGDDAIDRTVALYKALKSFPHAVVDMGPIGPASIAECRRVHLAHASHHLSFFVPVEAARRTGLRFADEDAVVADVRHLRKGCARAGNWTLPQACWHLDAALRSRMKPGPHPATTPEQAARRPQLEQVLASGRLPDGLVAPDHFTPPPACGDEAIDAFLATIEQFKAYPGPIVPHRLFGQLPDADARRLNLIHCAHHLSNLVPRHES